MGSSSTGDNGKVVAPRTTAGGAGNRFPLIQGTRPARTIVLRRGVAFAGVGALL
jgi:hypothetical protein